MPLAVGTRLGPYEIVGPLGAGGMGEVYRARDTRLRREVAIKVLAADLTGSPQAAARFEREWHVVARLSHPNILSLYDVGQHDGFTFAVMELVPGETLRQRLTSGALPARKALEYAIQIARGLGAAHQAGIVHRDLKPENVIITPDGHVKILDFGLARPESGSTPDGSTALVDITDAGVVLGTRSYMAPEQAKGEATDQRSDIFSFGAVLYEMLTGSRAFTGASPVEVLHAVIASDADASKLSPTHPAVRRIVTRCLEKRPEERFTSAHDLAYALEAALDALSGSSSEQISLERVNWKLRGLQVIVAAALLGAGVATGYLLRPDRGTHDTRRRAIPLRVQIQGPPGTTAGEALFSPDGRKVAALADSVAGDPAIWVRDSSGGEWRKVTTVNAHMGADWCEWSPDGQSLLYPGLVNGLARLRIVNVESSSVRTLQEDPFAEFEAAGRHNVLTEGPAGGAWSRESGILIGGPRLRLVSPETGAARDAVDADPSVGSQVWPSFLPDGRSFVFTQVSDDANKRGIFLGQVGSSYATRIVNVVGNARVTDSGHLLYNRNGALMAAPLDLQTRTLTGEPRSVASNLPVYLDRTWFSVSPANALAVPTTDTEGDWPVGTLQVFDRAGLRKRQLGDPEQYAEIQLSPDGRRLAVNSSSPLSVLDLQQGLRVPLQTVGTEFQLGSPAWAGNETVLVTQYTRQGRRNLASINTATGELRVLLDMAIARFPQTWASHSREIVAVRWEPDGTSLWALPEASPQDGRRLSRPGPYGVSSASLSADERWLAYASDETGKSEVYVQPFDELGERRRISSNGGTQPLWRQDGRELFYLDPDGAVIAVPMSTAMVPGQPARLFTLGTSGSAHEYAVMPDGQSFVAIVPAQKQAAWSISVLTDWTALVSR
jgi:eukaryotic-like serine/threonine-protein kinase